MKRNLLLYILLAFLLVVNGFFLFNHLAKPDRKEPKGPRDFIAKELKFDDEQLEHFRQLNDNHEKERGILFDEIKQLKDELFSKISNDKIDKEEIDSIAGLIGQKEQSKDRVVFYHFRSIRAICNENQKVRFDIIIEEGLHRGGGANGPPPQLRGRGNEPPPRN